MSRDPKIEATLPAMRADSNWASALAVSDGPAFTLDDVAFVLASEAGENDGPRWVAVFALLDNRYASVEAGCDYSGWDCMASGTRYVATSLADVVRFGLTDDGRRRLGFDVEQKAGEP